MLKRFVFLSFVLLCTSLPVFSQSDIYKSLMKKAKEYESKNEWVYALGYYADAFTEDPEYSIDAYNRYKEILNSIEKGNPGLEECAGVKLFNGWKSLLINAEKYWTEYSPYEYSLSKLELKNVVNETAADYHATLKVKCSEKFKEMMDAIVTGYGIARKDTWDLPKAASITYLENDSYFKLSSYWPAISISKLENAKKTVKTDFAEYYPVVKTQTSYNNKGVAVYSACPEYTVSENWNEKQQKNVKSYTETGIYEFYNAFAYISNEKLMYEVKIKVVDGKGKQLIAGKRFLPSFANSYEVIFENVPINIASIIDEGDGYPQIENIYLLYGYQSSEDFNSEDKMGFKAHLSELSIPLAKTEVYYLWQDNSNDFLDAKKKHEFDPLINKRFLQIKKVQSAEGVTYTFDIPGKKYAYYLDKEFVYELEDGCVPLWYMCNRFSVMSGLKPCYDKFGNPAEGNGYGIVEGGPAGKFIQRFEPLTSDEAYKRFRTSYSVAINYLDREDLASQLKIFYEGYNKDYESHLKEYLKAIEELHAATNVQNYVRMDYAVEAAENAISEDALYGEYSIPFEEYKQKAIGAEELYKSTASKIEKIKTGIYSDKSTVSEINSFEKTAASLGKALSDNILRNIVSSKEAVEKLDFTNLDGKFAEYKEKTSGADVLYADANEKITALEKLLKGDPASKKSIDAYKAKVADLHAALEIEDLVKVLSTKTILEADVKTIPALESTAAELKEEADVMKFQLKSKELMFADVKTTLGSSKRHAKTIEFIENQVMELKYRFESESVYEIVKSKPLLEEVDIESLAKDAESYKQIRTKQADLVRMLRAQGIRGDYIDQREIVATHVAATRFEKNEVLNNMSILIEKYFAFKVETIDKKSPASKSALKQGNIILIELDSLYELLSTAENDAVVELKFVKTKEAQNLSTTDFKVQK